MTVPILEVKTNRVSAVSTVYWWGRSSLPLFVHCGLVSNQQQKRHVSISLYFRWLYFTTSPSFFFPTAHVPPSNLWNHQLWRFLGESGWIFPFSHMANNRKLPTSDTSGNTNHWFRRGNWHDPHSLAVKDLTIIFHCHSLRSHILCKKKLAEPPLGPDRVRAAACVWKDLSGWINYH